MSVLLDELERQGGFPNAVAAFEHDDVVAGGPPSQVYGYQLVHATRTPDDADVAERYYNLLALPGRLVLDRCFISELVYGPLLHGRSRLTLEQVRDLVAVVKSRGGLLVHLTAAPETIAARLRRRDGIAPDLTLLAAVVSSYDEVFAELTTHARTVTVVSPAA